MATESQHSETMSGAPTSSEPADVGANAALILAALSRIEAVVRDERAAMASLRASLGEMTQAIARAKTVADSESAVAMLDEFEHRVDAMIEIAGGAPASEQAAEPDQVPTVSDVVLRLGPTDTAPEPAVADAAPLANTGGDKGPTVAMLTAMVQALSASIQTPTPEPEAAVAPPAPQVAEPTPSALATATEFTPWPVESEATAMTESVWKPVAEASPASMPGETLAQESTLLASFEQMEIRPFPPPEEGTAVIFTSNIFTSKIEPANPQAEHGFAPPGPPDAAATPDPAPAAPAEAAAPEVVAIEPEAAAPPPEGSVASKSVEAYFDPTDFLFGPEPEPDPAAFLLDPAPPPQTQKAVLPQPEFVSTPAEPPKAEELEPQPPKAGAPQAETTEVERPNEPTPEPHDPLHALKAMSPNEKLAIFS
jgi:hypothetical protein